MNHGQWIFAFVRRASAVTTVMGTIHRARASLTVVPTASATAPYLAAAPTTELVSWMASAAHSPNCDWLSLKKPPMNGKVSNATEFRTKIVPSETAISSLLAPATGPTAAIGPVAG